MNRIFCALNFPQRWRTAFAGVLATLPLLLIGCATPAQTAGLAIAGVAVVGSTALTDEIEQIYYLGIFDPLEQLPPTIYRVTVRGQASFLSGTDFATGWVPAPLIDSLSSSLKKTGEAGHSRFGFEAADTNAEVRLDPGRRLMLFGPEGFREAPRDYRLCIVMGADPKKFFEAVDQALGDMSQVSVEKGNTAIKTEMLGLYQRIAKTTERIDAVTAEVRQTLAP
jgi:hypothetical protein